jgi:hypothetical protein
MLFNVYIDHIARTAFTSADMDAHGYPFASDINGHLSPPSAAQAFPRATPHRLPFLLYADDLVLLSSTKAGLKALLRRLEAVSTDWAMTINYAKTKCMHFHPLPSTSPLLPPSLPSPITLAHGTTRFVETFPYLGTTLTPDGTLTAELSRRIGLTRAAFSQLSKLWAMHDVGIAVKMLVFKAIIPPTLLYGCEAWPLTTGEAHQLDVVLHDCLRSLLGIKRADCISNATIRKRCRDQPDATTMACKQRLRFLGHIARRLDHRFPKLLLFATHLPTVTAPPRSGGQTITSTLHKDLTTIRAQHNWYLNAQDKDAWLSMLDLSFKPEQ